MSTITARPVDLLAVDWAARLPLPPVVPTVGWINRVRLGRDYYVRVASWDYSVDPTYVAAAQQLRRDFQQPPAADPDGQLVRDLADYGRALSLMDTSIDAGPVPVLDG